MTMRVRGLLLLVMWAAVTYAAAASSESMEEMDTLHPPLDDKSTPAMMVAAKAARSVLSPVLGRLKVKQASAPDQLDQNDTLVEEGGEEHDVGLEEEDTEKKKKKDDDDDDDEAIHSERGDPEVETLEEPVKQPKQMVSLNEFKNRVLQEHREAKADEVHKSAYEEDVVVVVEGEQAAPEVEPEVINEASAKVTEASVDADTSIVPSTPVEPVDDDDDIHHHDADKDTDRGKDEMDRSDRGGKDKDTHANGEAKEATPTPETMVEPVPVSPPPPPAPLSPEPVGEDATADPVPEAPEASDEEAPPPVEDDPTTTEDAESVADDENDDDDDDEAPTAALFDFASFDAGATLLGHSAGMEGADALLLQSKDKYMMCPCQAKKWFVVQLSEDIIIDSVTLANLEYYSSSIRDFQVLGSEKYPADEWMVLGNFVMSDAHTEQSFTVETQGAWVRYVKFRLLTHVGSEYYCTLTTLSVHGSTMLESLRDDLESAARDVDDLQTYLDQTLDNGPTSSEGLEDKMEAPSLSREPVIASMQNASAMAREANVAAMAKERDDGLGLEEEEDQGFETSVVEEPVVVVDAVVAEVEVVVAVPAATVEPEAPAGPVDASTDTEVPIATTPVIECAEPPCDATRVEESTQVNETQAVPASTPSAVPLAASSRPHTQKSIFKKLTDRIKELEMNQALVNRFIDDMTVRIASAENEHDAELAALRKALARVNATMHTSVAAADARLEEARASATLYWRLTVTLVVAVGLGLYGAWQVPGWKCPRHVPVREEEKEATVTSPVTSPVRTTTTSTPETPETTPVDPYRVPTPLRRRLSQKKNAPQQPPPSLKASPHSVFFAGSPLIQQAYRALSPASEAEGQVEFAKEFAKGVNIM